MITLGEPDDFYYYFTDAQGSVYNIIDADGSIQNKYDYLLHGAEYDSWSESITNRYTFISAEFNSESGDYTFSNIIYNPNSGVVYQQNNNGKVSPTPWVQEGIDDPLAPWNLPKVDETADEEPMAPYPDRSPRRRAWNPLYDPIAAYPKGEEAVSYTHLTLPTKRIV